MPKPKACDPEDGYRYQILCRNREYERAWEHCDYAVDRSDKKHLLENYRSAYGPGWEFKTILQPAKFWPKQLCPKCGRKVRELVSVKFAGDDGIGSMMVCERCAETVGCR